MVWNCHSVINGYLIMNEIVWKKTVKMSSLNIYIITQKEGKHGNHSDIINILQ